MAVWEIATAAFRPWGPTLAISESPTTFIFITLVTTYYQSSSHTSHPSDQINALPSFLANGRDLS